MCAYCGTVELRTNKEIEGAAIAWVVEYEARCDRRAVDTRHTGAPTDLESPPRVIEVKAFGGSARGQDLWLEVRQVDEARRNPDFWLYLVENVRQGDPAQFRLVALGGEQLARLLARAVEHRYFTLPLPVGEYDQARNGSPS